MTRLTSPSRLLGPAIACALLASPAFAAFTGISIVKNDALTAAARIAFADASVPGAQAATVYRIYATFDGPGDGLNNTVVSTSFVQIFARQGFSFYQDPFGNALPPNEAFFPLAPTLQFDSYGTIGAVTQSDGGNVSIEPNTEETSFSYTGGWFTGNPPENVGAAMAQPDLDGNFGTLIFQFTMSCSDLSSFTPFVGNISLFATDSNNPGNTQQLNLPLGPLSPPCRADIAGNHGVNGADLASLLTQWGPVVVCSTQADFNFDGQINGADLAFLLANWGCFP